MKNLFFNFLYFASSIELALAAHPEHPVSPELDAFWQGFHGAKGKIEESLNQIYTCEFFNYSPDGSGPIYLQISKNEINSYSLSFSGSSKIKAEVILSKLHETLKSVSPQTHYPHQIYLRKDSHSNKLFIELSLFRSFAKNNKDFPHLSSQVNPQSEVAVSYGTCAPQTSTQSIESSPTPWPGDVLEYWVGHPYCEPKSKEDETNVDESNEFIAFNGAERAKQRRNRKPRQFWSATQNSPQLRTNKLDPSLVCIAKIPNKGLGLVAAKDIPSDVVIAQYPLDLAYDDNLSSNQVKAISNYARSPEQDNSFEAFAQYPTTSGTDEFDLEYAIDAFFSRPSNNLLKKYITFPLNPKERYKTPNQANFLGHLINDAAFINLDQEFLNDPTQEKMDLVVSNFLHLANVAINVKVESRAQVSPDGQVFLRMKSGRPIKAGEEIQFFYGPQYWLGKIYSKYKVKAELQRQIDDLYRHSAQKWLDENRQFARHRLFWWIQPVADESDNTNALDLFSSSPSLPALPLHLSRGISAGSQSISTTNSILLSPDNSEEESSDTREILLGLSRKYHLHGIHDPYNEEELSQKIQTVLSISEPLEDVVTEWNETLLHIAAITLDSELINALHNRVFNNRLVSTEINKAELNTNSLERPNKRQKIPFKSATKQISGISELRGIVNLRDEQKNTAIHLLFQSLENVHPFEMDDDLKRTNADRLLKILFLAGARLDLENANSETPLLLLLRSTALPGRWDSLRNRFFYETSTSLDQKQDLIRSLKHDYLNAIEIGMNRFLSFKAQPFEKHIEQLANDYEEARDDLEGLIRSKEDPKVRLMLKIQSKDGDKASNQPQRLLKKRIPLPKCIQSIDWDQESDSKFSIPKVFLKKYHQYEQNSSEER